jgi:hypothetical protein
LIVLEAISLLKHSLIHSWNEPVLSNECKVSCSRKKRLASYRHFEPTQSAILRLLVLCVNDWAMPQLIKLIIRGYKIGHEIDKNNYLI